MTYLMKWFSFFFNCFSLFFRRLRCSPRLLIGYIFLSRLRMCHHTLIKTIKHKPQENSKKMCNTNEINNSQLSTAINNKRPATTMEQRLLRTRLPVTKMGKYKIKKTTKQNQHKKKTIFCFCNDHRITKPIAKHDSKQNQ